MVIMEISVLFYRFEHRLPRFPGLIRIMLKVLYEDNHLIAVFKPAGILVQGDETGDKCLMDEVKEYLKKKYKKPNRPYPSKNSGQTPPEHNLKRKKSFLRWPSFQN